jgi:excisionase family DNA binding protein
MNKFREELRVEAPAEGRFEPIAVRVSDAVKMIGLGRSKIYELIASGDIEIVKVGAATLIPVASLRKLIGS